LIAPKRPTIFFVSQKNKQVLGVGQIGQLFRYANARKKKPAFDFRLRGASTDDPLTRGSAPGPSGGSAQTAVIGSHSVLTMRSPRLWPWIRQWIDYGANC